VTDTYLNVPRRVGQEVKICLALPLGGIRRLGENDNLVSGKQQNFKNKSERGISKKEIEAGLMEEKTSRSSRLF